MEHLVFQPKGVCSREVHIDHENGVILKAEVIGGCRGNLQGICRLIEGMKVEDVIAKLEGIKCRPTTSCPDQIAQGLKNILK